MTVAVLALQGAFIEHEHVLEELGVKTVELRQAADLDQPYDGLILPGGESTVQGKLLRELGMFDPLKKQIADGMPVLAPAPVDPFRLPGTFWHNPDAGKKKCLRPPARQFPYRS